MKKALDFSGIRKYSLVEIILLILMLLATVILTLKFVIKFDSRADICLHFIPIFIIGAIYGPLISAISSLIAYIAGTLYFGFDNINLLLCVTALLSGFIYGWLFYNKCEVSKSFFKRVFLCTAIQYVLYVFIESAIISLMSRGIDFNDLYSIRTIAAIVELFLQTAFLMLAPKYIGALMEFINKE